MARKIHTKIGKCHEFIWILLDPLPMPVLFLLPYQCPWHSPIVNHIETRTTLLTEIRRCFALRFHFFSLFLSFIRIEIQIFILILKPKAKKRFGSQQVVYILCTSISCSHKMKFSWLFIVHEFLISFSYALVKHLKLHAWIAVTLCSMFNLIR